MRFNVTCALAFFAVCLSSVSAQTVATVGGNGAHGCQGSQNPPLLDDGTLATGSLSYAWDAAAHNLTLVASNTSPVTPGVQCPLVTRVYANLPHLAVSSVSLVSQTGSGGATPNFSLDVDTNLHDGNNSLTLGCFGAFGIRLSRPNIQGGFSNPAADTIGAPANSWVVGPVTFVLHVDGPGVGSLTTSSFEHALSTNPPGDTRVNAAFKFQAGAQGGSGSIGNVTDCSPGGWMVGEPRIGHTVTFVESGQTGCYGCLVFSFTPGPTTFQGVTLPVGFPWYAINSDYFVAQNQVDVVQIDIPNDPAFIGLTLYFAVGQVDIATGTKFSVTDQFVETITS